MYICGIPRRLLDFLFLPCGALELGQVQKCKQEVFVRLDAESLEKDTKVLDEHNAMGCPSFLAQIAYRRHCMQS